MYDLISIGAIALVQSLLAIFLQAQSNPSVWDTNSKTVFGVLVAALATAVIVLWRSNVAKDREIKELNNDLINEIRLMNKNNKE